MLSNESILHIQNNYGFTLLEKFCVNGCGFDSDYCFYNSNFVDNQ